MTRTGEKQSELAAGIGLSQAQVSRKQSGAAHWSLDDVDRLAAHYRLPVLDLLAGPTHAVDVLHGTVPALQSGGLLAVPPVRLDRPAAAVPPPSAQPPASAGPCVLCGQPAAEEVDGFPQHLTAEECAAALPTDRIPLVPEEQALPLVPADDAFPLVPKERALAPVPPAAPPAAPQAVPEAPPAPAVAPEPRRAAAGYASGTLVEQITGRVHDVLAEHAGDLDAAQAALIKMAIPDVMALMKSSRVGGRYEHSEFPPTAEILHKKSQKGADEIWEGRPKWRNQEIFKAAKKGAEFEVTALDMNAAYLSALKCWLPIGQLREDTSGVHDKRKAGVHLITPADWDHADLPNPLGARQEPGELWVTESTLRQLLDCARQGLAAPPVIHRSLVSGATEALLEKMRRALAEVRKTALAQGDEITVAYVKAMYSKFVSTIGESSANRDIRRPDWMHIIRSKAFANLWMKAHKAHSAGLQVVEISGTDELHIVGDWRKVFSEGRDLNQVKVKDTYILGGKR
ncbi:acyltransferase [Streptomyces sp. NPDC012421]|uniref:acyltransferase n=1 Tax=Streptomyces sp. NPDC012421 TaxID=3364832 RepID=UPI0036EED41D